ncbi:TetR/AcrR family transcriptional regulator [Mycolicibacter minnesotensis]
MTEIKSGYHHGDLGSALVDAGLQLTRLGGPEALTIRAATRRVGVSPNAAYRHFADRSALLAAVAIAIQGQMAARMLDPQDHRGSPQARARSQLSAVGRGYIEFALDEPGWFSVAFFGSGITWTDGHVPRPFRALVEALDAMAETGVLQRDRRSGAEWPCWSAVHGFAELALRGPLRGTPRPELDALAHRTVEDIIAGLSG